MHPEDPKHSSREHLLPLIGAERIDVIVRILLTTAVAIGCYFVVRPFLSAILLSAVIAVVSWPVFDRLRTTFGYASTPAALLMILGLIVVVLIPFSVALVIVTQQLPRLVRIAGAFLKDPTPVLNALLDIPYAGPWIHEQIVTAIDPSTFSKTVEQIIEPVSRVLLSSAFNVSNGLIQLVLVTFIVFFFYRDGAWFADRIQATLARVSGGIETEIIDILTNTTRSVVFGILGTAVGQGVVAGIGFWIAGVPGVLMLSSAVCLLSVVPVGPPMVWGPAAVWLYLQGELGMAVFMVVWGVAAVSSVDNFLKPLLIARGTSLPLALIFLGVFGGVLAFGFLGLILGPLLLAIGIAMFQAWLRHPVLRRRNPEADEPGGKA